MQEAGPSLIRASQAMQEASWKLVHEEETSAMEKTGLALEDAQKRLEEISIAFNLVTRLGDGDCSGSEFER